MAPVGRLRKTLGGHTAFPQTRRSLLDFGMGAGQRLGPCKKGGRKRRRSSDRDGGAQGRLESPERSHACSKPALAAAFRTARYHFWTLFLQRTGPHADRHGELPHYVWHDV